MSVKENNEITVKLKCDIQEICKILENKGFKIIEKFTMDDKYMISKDTDIRNIDNREILSKAVLIRDIKRYISNTETKTITFKKKIFDLNGNIISQNAIDCDIKNIKDAINLLYAINYYQIMNIIENDTVYEKDGFQLAIKDIEGGDKLIEIETNDYYKTIGKIKEKLKKLNLPIDYSNYFIKKAEIELDKVKNGK